MKDLSKCLFTCAICALAHLMPRTTVGELPAYRQFVPMVAIHATSISDATRVLNDGLSGSGVEIQPADAAKRLAEACFLPSFAGVDLRRPAQFFLLSPNPPSAMPEQAVILPLHHGGATALLRSLREHYASVEGGSIKICSDPLDGKSVTPLYIAIADGNAMLSPNVDAIRWMAFHLQSKAIPEPPTFRRAPLSASADAKLVGLLLDLVASLDGEDVSEEATTDNKRLHIRELGTFFSAFQRVEVALDASISQWDASFRLVDVPGGKIAEAVAALKPPDDTWMEFFPTFACNQSASCLPGFFAALPASNRKWLASLADNTRIVGHGIFPSAFELDEKLRPLLTGTALSAFVTDKPGGRFGSITVCALKSPEDALKVLGEYFAPKGAGSANPRIGRIVPGERNGVAAYNTVADKGIRQKSEIGNASEAVSLALNLHHIELAVRGDWLFIARGTSGFIEPWLADKRVAPWDEKVSSLTAVFPDQPGETVLGGGSMDPVSLARKIIAAVPDFNQFLPKMPHAGSGFAWRMARKGGEARFDLRLYGNEIVACNRLIDLTSDTIQQLFSQLVLRYLPYSTDSGGSKKESKHNPQ